MFPIEEKFKQLTTMTKVIILVFFLGLFFAGMFRYSAPVKLDRNTVSVTDRWTGCVTYHIYGMHEKKYTSCP